MLREEMAAEAVAIVVATRITVNDDIEVRIYNAPESLLISDQMTTISIATETNVDDTKSRLMLSSRNNCLGWQNQYDKIGSLALC